MMLDTSLGCGAGGGEGCPDFELTKTPDERFIVSLSGGKDSTAMLLMLLENKHPVDDIVFFDTGWEFPQMLEHIDKLEKYIGRPITRLHPEKPVLYWMLEREFESKHYGPCVGYGWPHSGARWCTRRKINTLEKHKKTTGGGTSLIGFAADEQHREKQNKNSTVLSAYPLIDAGMTEAQALQFCYDRGFDWGGLYRIFARTSCFCCPLQRVGELRLLRQHFPELWSKMLEWEEQMTRPLAKRFKGRTVSLWEKRFANENLLGF
jgi:3'-phosphoadenosine 5'-phosphosulfate sulfotransferase (PAPS reductase)/FAD synthetase